MQLATPRRHAAAAAAVVVAALLGAWLGHTLEYLRVGGAPGLGTALAAGVHVYMLPLGVLLVLAAAAGAAAGHRAWLGLGLRLDTTRAALFRALRGHAPGPAFAAGPVVSVPGRLLALWLPLGAVQIALYLGQENLETLLAGRPAAGLAPLLGAHRAAAGVQLAVALVLAAALLLAGRLLAGRARELARCVRLLRVLAWSRRCAGDAPAAPILHLPAPVERFGRQLWSRPPPLVP